MADTARYTLRGMSLSGTQRAVRSGGYTANHETESIRNAGTLTQEMLERMQTRPAFDFDMLDPSIVTTWQTIASSGATYTALATYWQAYADQGGLGSTWKSASVAKGVLFPVSLSTGPQRTATLRVRCLPLYVSGTAVTWGTSSFTPDVADIAYRLTKVTINAVDYTDVEGISIDWRWNVQYPEKHTLEPTELYYDDTLMTARIELQNLATATSARLEDTAVETVSALFTDQKNGANTVTVNLSTCRTMWDLSDPALAIVNAQQVTS